MRKRKQMLACVLSASLCLNMLPFGGVNSVQAKVSDGPGQVRSGMKNAAEEEIEISEANFPDESFRSYINDRIDIGTYDPESGETVGAGDGKLSAEERNAVMSIYMDETAYRRTEDITGIGYFKELTSFSFSSSKLRSADFSGNPKIQTVWLYGNTLLESVSVAGCKELTSINCGNCKKLSALNLTGSDALQSLDCSDGNLSKLEVGGLTSLTNIHCGNNHLTELDVSKLTKLTSIYCYGNQLSTLDVGDLTELTDLHCNNNQLTVLDVSKLTKLTSLDCGSNQLTALDVGNLTELTSLNCYSNQIAELDVSALSKLTNLYCENNQLQQLDLSATKDLINLEINSNNIWSIDLTEPDMVQKTYMYDESNQIAWQMSEQSFSLKAQEDGTWLMDLSEIPGGFDPKKYSFYSNDSLGMSDQKPQITEKGLIWEENPFLQNGSPLYFGLRYDLSNGSFMDGTYLGIPIALYRPGSTENPSVTTAPAADEETLNQQIALTEEDFPDKNFRKYLTDAFDQDGDGNVRLGDVTGISMDYQGLAIKDLTGVEKFTELIMLDAENNLLKEVDLSKNTKLQSVDLYGNENLTSINLTGCVYLTSLRVGHCKLDSIDLTGLEKLTSLSVFDTQIKELDISRLKRLQSLECGSNKLSSLELEGLTELTSLNCGNNNIRELNIGELTKLNYLDCSNNSIKELDISGLEQLQNLYCSSNQLKYLDISSLSNLTNLEVSGNHLWGLDTSASQKLNPGNSWGNVGEKRIIWQMDEQRLALKEQEDGSWSVDLSDVKGYLPAKYFFDDTDSMWNHIDQPKLTENGLTWSYNPLQKSGFSSLNFTLYYDLSNDAYLDEKCMGIPVSIQNQVIDQELIEKEVELTEDNFPDANFRKYLTENFDPDGDERFQPGQYTAIDLQNQEIADLTGIEYFAQLDWLYCQNNKLTSLDVRSLSRLNTLYCDNNQISDLKIGGLAQLSSLSCSDNRISDLDTTGCTSLSYVYASSQKLGQIPVNKMEDGSFIAKSEVLKNILPQISPDGKDQDGNWYWNGDFVEGIDLCEEGWQWNTDPLQGKYSKGYELRKPYTVDLGSNGQNHFTLYLSFTLVNTYDDFQFESVEVDEKNFPDEAFREYLLSNYVKDRSDPKIDAWEVESLDLFDPAIKDLTGIEHFTEISYLYLSGLTELKKLDLSKNTKLVQIELQNLEQIHVLDFSALDQLQYFYPYGMTIYALRFSEDAEIKSYVSNTELELTAVEKDGKYILELPKEIDMTDPRIFDMDERPADGVISWDSKEEIPLRLSYKYLYSQDYVPGENYNDSDYLTVNITLTNNAPEKPKSKKVELSEKNFPDTVFRNYLKKNYANGTDTIDTSQITSFDIWNGDGANPIKDLTGIELLNCLNSINLSEISINALKLTGNPVITSVYIWGVPLTELDVTGCPYLEYLNVEYRGALPEIDLSKNKYLTNLSLRDNSLSELDLSENTKLKALDCTNNSLRELDLSNNTKLQRLNVSNNALTTLDLSNQPDLIALNVQYQKDGNMSTPDLSVLTKLQELEISGSTEEKDGVVERELLDLTKCKNLTLLRVSGYELQGKISEMAFLNDVNISDCVISEESLDFSAMENLRYLDLMAPWSFEERETAKFERVDLHGLEKLRSFSINGYQVDALDASGCTSLTNVNCSGMGLKELDVSGDKALNELWCTNNQLTKLDVSDNVALQTLYCYDNKLTEIDISKNRSLKNFQCFGNPITSLDLSNNKAMLEEVNCNNAALTSLDVSENTELATLEVNDQNIEIPTEEMEILIDGEIVSDGTYSPEPVSGPEVTEEPMADPGEVIVTTEAPKEEPVPTDQPVDINEDEKTAEPAKPAEPVSETAEPAKTAEPVSETGDTPAITVTSAPKDSVLTEISDSTSSVSEGEAEPVLKQLFNRLKMGIASLKKAEKIATLRVNLKKYGKFNPSMVSDLDKGWEATEEGLEWNGSAADLPKSVSYTYDVSNKHKLENKFMPVTISIGGDQHTSMPDESEKPDVTMEPDQTVKPGVTAKPAQSAKPNQTKKPAETSAPDSQQPSVPDSPAISVPQDPQAGNQAAEAGAAGVTAASDNTNTAQADAEEPEEEEGDEEEDDDEAKSGKKAGSTIAAQSSSYKVLAGKKLVYTGSSKKKAKSVTIPATIKKNGVTYKVTQIQVSAFKGNKKLKSVTIGKEITKIGNDAFNGCSALKKIDIKTQKLGASSIGKNAFKGISAKAKITCPKGKAAVYQKYLKKSGLPKSAKVK